MGCYFVPDQGPWNYNFMGVKLSPTQKYGVRLGVPKEFYHESHRPGHFMSFAALEDEKVATISAATASSSNDNDVDVDREDLFE
jgi:pre-mRNA-processing factor 8